ncbi:delta-lactam-biosynthetic de-N-acetylase [Bacillus aquiflavi]|uniref:Delta-lactam-biosynthetic de-N-acetylase n=1 Tax=Bacillus aquiflavi TaxID=2672567 RepID=A0A6B3W340_9BACI|nr:delta-lactam-biosynthetic de-N-acetylase [Bacillus aquiflavi]MBA4538035.1 delta-lactam-biosynthetic de-N-acetylase [Bacillus aquiflavi]NEY82291.1 delta-lactam-biosynthetic de-N-acetylase [Bacillus aquiflavi]
MKKYLIGFIFVCLFLFGFNTAFSMSNKAIHWGFKKAENEQPAEAGKVLDDLLEKYGAFYKGDSSKKEIYLTFDNGYENGYTEKILNVLKKEKVPATFFVTGHYLRTAPELVKRMKKEGHIIGNHSWHHPDLTTVSNERLRQELEKVRAETERLTGERTMVYLRPPRGIFSERTLALTKEEGYTHVLWSLAFIDWHVDQQKGWKYSYDQIMKQIHPGAVLLLHTVSKDNADALEKAIQDLKKKGYTFKSLDDLVMGKAMHKNILR